MGDNGQLYIPEDEVPQYKALLREADLILPNQFEAESVPWIRVPFKRLTQYLDSYPTPKSPTSTP